MGDRPLFLADPKHRNDVDVARLELSDGNLSDQWVIMNAFRGLLKASSNIFEKGGSRKFANYNSINHFAYEEADKIRAQIAQSLKESQLVDDDVVNHVTREFGGVTLNQFSDFIAVIKGVMLKGYHPDLAVVEMQRGSKGKKKVLKTPCGSVMMHPSSINDKAMQHFVVGTLVTYASKNRSKDGGGVFVR